MVFGKTASRGSKRTTSSRPKSRGGARIVSKERREIDGFDVTIVRKSVKTLRLRVKDASGRVEVSAPTFVGNALIERMIRERRSWILQQQARLAQSPSARAQNATKQEIAQWRAVAEACVPPLIEAWEPIMGVKAGKLAYRNMTSQWGSCQPSTGRICINIRLALYPPECLEYVVVHELCHLIVSGHGPAFQRAMDTFMPDWRERKAKLR